MAMPSDIENSWEIAGLIKFRGLVKFATREAELLRNRSSWLSIFGLLASSGCENETCFTVLQLFSNHFVYTIFYGNHKKYHNKN